MEELRDPLLIKPWLAGTKCAVAAGVSVTSFCSGA